MTGYKLLHVAFTAAGIRAIYAGLGTKDENSNEFLQIDGRKVFSYISSYPVFAN